MDKSQTDLLELTVRTVSAYVGSNAVSPDDLPGLIHNVYAQLSVLAVVELPQALPGPMPDPAVNPRKSVQDDYIVCLEDGKRFKSLKRHLRTHYNLSPKQYRGKWGLPPDYPMTAPSYAAARSRIAKNIGLGRKISKQNRSEDEPNLA